MHCGFCKYEDRKRLVTDSQHAIRGPAAGKQQPCHIRGRQGILLNVVVQVDRPYRCSTLPQRMLCLLSAHRLLAGGGPVDSLPAVLLPVTRSHCIKSKWQRQPTLGREASGFCRLRGADADRLSCRPPQGPGRSARSLGTGSFLPGACMYLRKPVLSLDQLVDHSLTASRQMHVPAPPGTALLCAAPFHTSVELHQQAMHSFAAVDTKVQWIHRRPTDGHIDLPELSSHCISWAACCQDHCLQQVGNQLGRCRDCDRQWLTEPAGSCRAQRRCS